MNESLTLFCLCVQLWLYLLNCLYLDPSVVSLLPFCFSPPSHWEGASERLCGAELLPGLKPQHLEIRVQSEAFLCLVAPGRPYSVWAGDSNSLVHAVAFRRSYTGFPLGSLLSLRTSRASATGWQPPSHTGFKKRQMALQDPGLSTHSRKTTSMRTLSVCACASGGCTRFI